MKKVLAFFGAFNPPTKAHIKLAKYAMEKTHLDGVIFIPSQTNYIIKEQKKDFAFSDVQRLRMLYEVTSRNEWWADYCLHDIRSNTQPKTYETLNYLKGTGKFNPKLLIGIDQFIDMETKWQDVDKIAQEFGIVVLSRENYKSYKEIMELPFYKKLSKYVTFIQTPNEYNEISSTKARQCFFEMKLYLDELKKILPQEIFEYMMRGCLDVPISYY